jgi:hypothetical protein
MPQATRPRPRPSEPSGDGDEGRDGGPDDDVGVEIEITPAGKATKRLSLLSGGEKSMTAIAFLFAVFLARPCPFYILDEVEAALDDLNIARFLERAAASRRPGTVLVVTHQRGRWRRPTHSTACRWATTACRRSSRGGCPGRSQGTSRRDSRRRRRLIAGDRLGRIRRRGRHASQTLPTHVKGGRHVRSRSHRRRVRMGVAWCSPPGPSPSAGR